ncbi:MAG: orotidine-5'-phosphate decarboxylase [Chloroflexota bacterium]|nr:MAG: orotidine-5'-phosphate decarboxylase [Chloroflexota bacterium]
MSFRARLTAAARTNNSWLCVGLDPDPTLMPPVSVLEFNKAIIDATRDLVCAYKPNVAFYQAFGPAGLEMLYETVRYIGGAVPVIADAKCADVGHTAAAYARGFLQTFGFDAVTVNPYLGYDGVKPFLEFDGKGVFLLCRTSNPGAADVQGLRCIEATPGEQAAAADGEPLFEVIARKAASWDSGGRLGLVVGATSVGELQRVRELCPDMLFLIPGVGPQGGDLEESIRVGVDSFGESAIINASRQVTYASRREDFPAAARAVALHLRDRINALRKGISRS